MVEWWSRLITEDWSNLLRIVKDILLSVLCGSIAQIIHSFISYLGKKVTASSPLLTGVMVGKSGKIIVYPHHDLTNKEYDQKMKPITRLLLGNALFIVWELLAALWILSCGLVFSKYIVAQGGDIFLCQILIMLFLVSMVGFVIIRTIVQKQSRKIGIAIVIILLYQMPLVLMPIRLLQSVSVYYIYAGFFALIIYVLWFAYCKKKHYLFWLGVCEGRLTILIYTALGVALFLT